MNDRSCGYHAKLCWAGKNIEEKPEPRVLIEDPEKSYGESDTENMLIHADNLLALKALEQKFFCLLFSSFRHPKLNHLNKSKLIS